MTNPSKNEVPEGKCLCCNYTSIGGELGESGYQLARGVIICSFCKLLFPSIVPAKVDLSDLEFLGAWSELNEEFGSFHLNVTRNMTRARVPFNDLMPDCLQAWLVGSAIPSAAQQEAVAYLWPLTASTRILELIEVAAVLADDYDHCADLDTLRAIVARDDVAPVWASWLASNAWKGKAPREPGKSLWAWYGQGHAETCADWAAARARAVISR